jgi:hypothetical protein
VRIVGNDEEATNIVRYEMADERRSFTPVERYRSPSTSCDNTWLERQAGEPQKARHVHAGVITSA